MASFEVDMNTWLDSHRQVLGSEDWTITSVDSETMISRAQAHFKAGEFHQGYTSSALAVCTGAGFQNQFSKVAPLVNKELDLPEENLVEVVRRGLVLPNPFT